MLAQSLEQDGGRALARRGCASGRCGLGVGLAWGLSLSWLLGCPARLDSECGGIVAVRPVRLSPVAAVPDAPSVRAGVAWA